MSAMIRNLAVVIARVHAMIAAAWAVPGQVIVTHIDPLLILMARSRKNHQSTKGWLGTF